MSNGRLYVISAPSGAGKTSLVKALVKETRDIRVSVSYTTRPPRPGEQDGIDYTFVSMEMFQNMLAQNMFMEYAQVFDNYYGTSWQWTLAQLQQGQDVILEIDWQGAQQIRAAHPACVLIFILPPSRQTLEQRLRGRGQDSDAVIMRRMRDAVNEMRHYDVFDYVVINDNFQTALQDLQAIVCSYRLQRATQETRHQKLLQELLVADVI